jgi:cation:H+ antiporter
MIQDILIFIASMTMVIQGAHLSTKHAALLAKSLHLSKFVVGFIIVAIISILPETLISINAAIEGTPSFGLGTLFGSNIADLTLLFTILVIVAKRSLRVENKILKRNYLYPFLLLLPLFLGLNGHYSRIEGGILIAVGIFFNLMEIKNGTDGTLPFHNGIGRYKHVLKLLFGMGLLLIGAHFTVTSAVSMAHLMGINPILIGMLVVGLGTTMPELLFSMECVRNKDDSLAIGDLLGTVLADATIVVGVLALISPFTFPLQMIYITGTFMAMASLLLFFFMKTGREISKKEAAVLFIFWLSFVVIEFLADQ